MNASFPSVRALDVFLTLGSTVRNILVDFLESNDLHLPQDCGFRVGDGSDLGAVQLREGFQVERATTCLFTDD